MRTVPDEALDAESPIHSPARPKAHAQPAVSAAPAHIHNDADSLSDSTRPSGARRPMPPPPTKAARIDTPFPRERDRLVAHTSAFDGAAPGSAAVGSRTPTKPLAQRGTLKRTAVQRSPQSAAPNPNASVSTKKIRTDVPTQPLQPGTDDVFTVAAHVPPQNDPDRPSLPAHHAPDPANATEPRTAAHFPLALPPPPPPALEARDE